MNKKTSIDLCREYIQHHMDKHPAQDQQDPSITISRLTGANGSTIANILSEYLSEKSREGAAQWTVFDKNLLKIVLEDNDLPQQMEKYIPESKISGYFSVFEELFGLHPAHWKLVQTTTNTIYRLAKMGHAIIIGRGANIITANLPNVFHVRLVGSVKFRAERIEKRMNFSHLEALDYIKKTDQSRADYVKQYYNKQVDDPLFYHLVINTDRLSAEEIVKIIGDAVLLH